MHFYRKLYANIQIYIYTYSLNTMLIDLYQLASCLLLEDMC